MSDRLSGETWWTRLRWSLGVSLTGRILAVNIIALGLLAGSLLYLDNYRNRLLLERSLMAQTEVELMADSMAVSNRAQRRALAARVGTQQKIRLRLYNADGDMLLDSFDLEQPSYEFTDPDTDPFLISAARSIDRGMDFVLGTPPVPIYEEPAEDTAEAWPEIEKARAAKATVVQRRQAHDLTPVFTAAAPVGSYGQVLLTTRPAPEITQNVRNARQTLAIIVVTALLTSILLSLFLARTIVQPLRMLVRAAVRVRLGRDREVVVPRLPDRRDEIGLLARALSDMTSALRQRIDAGESFAADIAHEVKNPLASLRSALESLPKVKEPHLREQLHAIAVHDVRRLDRLVTEISNASRLDAELSRTTFEPCDIYALIHALADTREQRRAENDCRLAINPHGDGPWIVSGDAGKLERVMQNLIDNAASFSPPDGKISLELSRQLDRIIIQVNDDGPGIPTENREKVFERFHSHRPAGEDFGQHSGLGLAIARTIVEAHDGTLTVQDRVDGKPGACLVVDIPAWQS